MPILERSSNLKDLLDNGPVVDVEVFQTPAIVSQIQASGQPLPSPFVGRFLIDTGARSTIIKPHIAQQLTLKQVGVTSVLTPNMTSSGHPVYVASIKIILGNQTISIDAIPVTELPLKGQRIDGLIGRDILSNKQFIYTGFTGRFSLAV